MVRFAARVRDEVGPGAVELSIRGPAILTVKTQIRSLTLTQARELAEQACTCVSAN